MVNINGVKLKIYDLDSIYNIIERVAASLDTLPKYLYGFEKFQDNAQGVESLIAEKNIIIEDQLDVIRNTQKLDISKLPSLDKTEIVNLWIALHDRDEKIIKRAKEKFSDITIATEIESKNMLEKLNKSIEYNKKKVEVMNLDNEKFKTLEGIKKTDFIVEKTDFKLVLDLNIGILELFNKIILTEQIPVSICDKFTKISKNFFDVEESDWDLLRMEDLIVMKVNSQIKKNRKKYIDAFIGKDMITINKKREEYIIIKLTVETNTEANLENEENIINNIMNTIPGISIYKKLVDNTEGNFIFPKQNLNVYVFAELVMNNKLFSSRLIINESSKASKDKNDVFVVFTHPNFDKTRCFITPRVADRNDINIKNGYVKVGEPYIRLNITKSKNESNVIFFMNVMSKLFEEYNNLEGDIVKEYEKYLPDFITEYGNEAQDVENEAQGVENLEDINPELFITGKTGYKKRCGKEKVVSIVKDEDVERLKEEGVPLLYFPKTPEEGPQYWYRCTSEEYKYPGLTKSTLENKDKYPFFPCCYKVDQTTKLKSPYNEYFKTETKIENILPPTESGVLTSKKKIMTFDKLAYLPDELQTFFKSINQDWEYVRIGMDNTPSSFLQCVIKAVNPDILSNDDEIYRKDAVNIAREELKDFAVCRQEAYDKTYKGIKDIVKDENKYLDPKIFIRLLEETYTCNIYLFERTDSGQTTMIIPNHVHGYYRFKKEVPSLCILIHKGSDIDINLYDNPQCELIGRFKNNQELKYLFQPKTKLFNEISNTFNKLSKTYTLCNKLSEIYFPLPDDIKLVSQKIDSYGKTRSLNIEFNGQEITIITSPIPPLGIPELKTLIINRINDITAKELINKFKNILTDLQSDKKNLSIFGKIGNVSITIPLIENPDSIGKETDSIMNIYNNNKKIALFIQENLFWLFSTYVTDKDNIENYILPFFKDKTTLIKKFTYKPTTNSFVKNNGIIEDGKLIVTSTQMKQRLAYLLKLAIQYNIKRLINYKDRISIQNVYSNITDFEKYPSQIILEGKDSIKKWLTEKNKTYKLQNKLIDGNTPYFFQNNLISHSVYIAQNTTTWKKAVSIAIEWYNNKINTEGTIKYTNESFNLYQYISETEINNIKIKGGENDYDIKIIGTENKTFTVLLPC